MAAGPPRVADIVKTGDHLPQELQYAAMDGALQGAHNHIHSGCIRGTIANPLFSFHDPFVFLIHSNVDRLWVRWRNAPGHAWRLGAEQVYGVHDDDPASTVNAVLQPAKTSKYPTIVAPAQYDR